MSIQASLVKHLDTAKTQFTTQLSIDDASAKAEVKALEGLIGPITGPLDTATLNDALQRALHQNVGGTIFGALGDLVLGSLPLEQIVGLVNDPARFASVIAEGRAELVSLRGQLLDHAYIENIEENLPGGVSTRKSKDEIREIAIAIRDFSVAITDLLISKVDAIGHDSVDFHSRAEGTTRLSRMSESAKFLTKGGVHRTVSAFDFNADAGLSKELVAKYPALGALVGRVTASDLPEEIVVKGALGIPMQIDNNDPSDLNRAAFTTYSEKNARSYELREALTIAAMGVKLTDGKEPAVLDTLACIAARLGNGALANEAHALAASLDASSVVDSRAALAALQSGEYKAPLTSNDLRKDYPAFAATCDAADPTQLPKVTFRSVFGEYEANFKNPEHLNRFAWATFENSAASAEELRVAAHAAGLACRYSDYELSSVVDTLAQIERRRGNTGVADEADKLAAKLDAADKARAEAKVDKAS